MRLDKAVLLKRLFSIIERNLLIKKFIKEIIYSKENIKITFFYSENFKNFSLENSPARRQAGRASVPFESQESLNPINKEEFVSQSMARGQGFEPRLPGPKPGVLPLDDPRIIK